MLSLLPVVISYLLGSVPFGLIVTRLAGLGDVRQFGSGNIGSTNVWRVAGFKVAVWVFVGDIGKGVLAVLLAKYYVTNYSLILVGPDLFYVICAVAAIVGHIFPIYLRFKGGKGVNTALGAIATLLPIESLISIGVFLLIVLIFRYVSLGSICGALGFCAAVLVEKYTMKTGIDMVYVYLSILVAVLILLTHKQNIGRLIAGTESRLSLSKTHGKGENNG
jgi:glycerol-3-phosphate acyltransferase PlsY